MASAEQTGRFELSWQAPTGCPVREAVVREIDELVAGSSPTAPGTSIDAHASIVNDTGGFALALSVRDAEGLHERRLDAPNCEELGHAAALIVALAIDPALLATHSDPGGAVPGAAAPAQLPSRQYSFPVRERPVVAPPAATVAPSVPTISEATTKSLAWRLGLSEFIGYRTLPGTNLGTGAFGAIQIDSLRFEAMASAMRAEARASKPGAGGTFALYRFAAKGCWFFAQSKWSLGPCAGMELGLLRGRGYGVDMFNDPDAPWIASTFGMLFEVPLAQTSLFGIAADAEVPWVRDEFKLAGAVLFQPQVAGRFGASLAAGW